jgi:hypothetical protein
VTDARDPARRIAGGHAYRKHVVQRREFPEVAGVEQFAEPIADVILNPDAQKSLPGERHTYWQERSRTVVLLNPNDSDGGTAIRPESERSYLDRA